MRSSRNQRNIKKDSAQPAKQSSHIEKKGVKVKDDANTARDIILKKKEMEKRDNLRSFRLTLWFAEALVKRILKDLRSLRSCKLIA